MGQAFYILFGALFTVAVCFSAGRLLLRPAREVMYREEHNVLAFVAGAAVVSLAIFALAATHLIHKGVLLVAGLAVIAAAVRTRAFRPAGNSPPSLPSFWWWTFRIVFTLFFAWYLVNAMAPEMSPDGSTYHLGLVSRYYREHGFSRITTNIYANLSQGVELLFVLAWAFGKNSAAALVHLSFLVALVLAIVLYGRRIGHPAAGTAAALFVFVSPVVGVDATSAYNDVALACVLFGLFYLVQVWTAGRQSSLLIPIGLLAGFGYGIKYTAFLAVPYALGVVAWRLWRAREPLVRPLVIVALCAALLIVPWMVKNAVVLHNPVSPFLNGRFPNPYVHVGFEQEWSAFLRTYGLTDRWQIPTEVTVRGQVLGGFLGPIFLLAPLALFSLRFSAGRQLLLAGTVFLLPFPANIGTRFLIPPLPFWAFGMALAMEAWRGVLLALVLAHALLSWPTVTKRYCATYAWRIAEFPWKAALRITKEELWLREKSPDYSVARRIEAETPPPARIFSFGNPMEAYVRREIVVAFQGAENQVLRDILVTPLVRELQPIRKLSFAFPPRAMRKFRVIQDARAEPDSWSVSELRVLHEQRELNRAPQWRLRASPNPWDVQMAFDNSPVTRWRSWQTLEPGMFIEVDFGREETVDSVVLEMTDDQGKVSLHLEMDDGQRLAPKEERIPPPPFLRRYAIQELKARGIQYLLISDLDYGAADFIRNTRQWGVTLVAEIYARRIYRLD